MNFCRYIARRASNRPTHFSTKMIMAERKRATNEANAKKYIPFWSHYTYVTSRIHSQHIMHTHTHTLVNYNVLPQQTIKWGIIHAHTHIQKAEKSNTSAGIDQTDFTRIKEKGTNECENEVNEKKRKKQNQSKCKERQRKKRKKIKCRIIKWRSSVYGSECLVTLYRDIQLRDQHQYILF